MCVCTYRFIPLSPFFIFEINKHARRASANIGAVTGLLLFTLSKKNQSLVNTSSPTGKSAKISSFTERETTKLYVVITKFIHCKKSVCLFTSHNPHFFFSSYIRITNNGGRHKKHGKE